LEHSLPKSIRTRGTYVLSDDAFKKARLLKDDQERPLWVASMTANVPSTINGRPYVIDDGMPDVTTGETPVLFGDFTSHAVRQVNDIQLLRLGERYAERLQVGFLAWTRMDARRITPDHRYKALKMA
jgi:HK97 family phage major capsid protein